MSLINEALKKAQHQRTGSALDAPPMPGGGSGGGRGSQGMPKGTLVLLIAGAAVVVVISVVATVYFVNRTPAPIVTVAPAVTPPGVTAPAPVVAAPSPVIITPVIIKAPTPVVELPSAPPPVVEQPTTAPAAATAAPAPAPEPEPVAEGSLADRIANYVDKVRVTGIRTSETGSKVLMNDRVYRLNDVVDRKLGLRLVKIDPDSLTFADASGATYIKNF